MKKNNKTEITVITVFDNKHDAQQLFIELIINKRRAEAADRLRIRNAVPPFEGHCDDIFSDAHAS